MNACPPRHCLGYPRPYAGVLAARAGCVAGCLPVLLMLVWLSVFYLGVFRQHHRPGSLIALILCMVFFGFFSVSLSFAFQRPSVFPRFHPKMRHCARWDTGCSIARNCRVLDGLAEAHGLVPLSAFGFRRASRESETGWYDPAAALVVLRALQPLVARSGLLVPDPGTLLGELRLLEDAMMAAVTAGARFHLVFTG